MMDSNKNINTVSTRVFVIREEGDGYNGRPFLHAIREDMIKSVSTISGSQACFLQINGITTTHNFDDFVALLGKRIDIV